VKYLGTSAYEYVPYHGVVIPVNANSAYGPISPTVPMRTSFSFSAGSIRLVDSGSGYPATATASGGVYVGPLSTEIYYSSSSLTTYRPYNVQANNSTSAYVYLSAEL
jgi:hypothetical protein